MGGGVGGRVGGLVWVLVLDLRIMLNYIIEANNSEANIGLHIYLLFLSRRMFSAKVHTLLLQCSTDSLHYYTDHRISTTTYIGRSWLSILCPVSSRTGTFNSSTVPHLST